MAKDIYILLHLIKVSRVYIYKRNLFFFSLRERLLFHFLSLGTTESEGGTPEDERAQDNEPNDEKAPYTQKRP